MPTDLFQQSNMPTSTLRHRRIGAPTQILPITVQRASRQKHIHAPHKSGGPHFAVAAQAAQSTIPWMLPIVGTMLATIVLLWAFQFIWAWGMMSYNDLRYGYPRITQADAVVGHQDSASHPTHFLALNLHGRVEIIELPGGDPGRARIIEGPQLSGEHADLVPIILQFVTHAGSSVPDLSVQCGGIEVRYRDENGSFTLQ